MTISAVTILGTAIPAAPGYLGTYKLAASAAGTALGLLPETALALTVLIHAITLIPLITGGPLAGLSMRIDS